MYYEVNRSNTRFTIKGLASNGKHGQKKKLRCEELQLKVNTLIYSKQCEWVACAVKCQFSVVFFYFSASILCPKYTNVLFPANLPMVFIVCQTDFCVNIKQSTDDVMYRLKEENRAKKHDTAVAILRHLLSQIEESLKGNVEVHNQLSLQLLKIYQRIC